MNAYLTKGKKTVQVYNDGDVVITTNGYGTTFRETTANAEALAEEIAARHVIDGYTREDVK